MLPAPLCSVQHPLSHPFDICSPLAWNPTPSPLHLAGPHQQLSAPIFPLRVASIWSQTWVDPLPSLPYDLSAASSAAASSASGSTVSAGLPAPSPSLCTAPPPHSEDNSLTHSVSLESGMRRHYLEEVRRVAQFLAMESQCSAWSYSLDKLWVFGKFNRKGFLFLL